MGAFSSGTDGNGTRILPCAWSSANPPLPCSRFRSSSRRASSDPRFRKFPQASPGGALARAKISSCWIFWCSTRFSVRGCTCTRWGRWSGSSRTVLRLLSETGARWDPSWSSPTWSGRWRRTPAGWAGDTPFGFRPSRPKWRRSPSESGFSGSGVGPVLRWASCNARCRNAENSSRSSESKFEINRPPAWWRGILSFWFSWRFCSGCRISRDPATSSDSRLSSPLFSRRPCLWWRASGPSEISFCFWTPEMAMTPSPPTPKLSPILPQG